jgi:Uma2 family endonuclease
MSTAEAKRPREQAGRAQRFRLDQVSWRDYKSFLRLFVDRPGIRLTYDRGRLEISTVSFEHSGPGEILRLLVFALARILRIHIRAGGSPTLKWNLARRGLEPDKCLWIQNVESMRGKKRYNIETDIPPDLVLEVDIPRSSLRRMSIYAALQVPEVWRRNRRSLKFYHLGPDGKFVLASHRRVFSFLAAQDLLNFISSNQNLLDDELLDAFDSWVLGKLSVNASLRYSPMIFTSTRFGRPPSNSP